MKFQEDKVFAVIGEIIYESIVNHLKKYDV